jgi:hypothetical protein
MQRLSGSRSDLMFSQSGQPSNHILGDAPCRRPSGDDWIIYRHDRANQGWLQEVSKCKNVLEIFGGVANAAAQSET